MTGNDHLLSSSRNAKRLRDSVAQMERSSGNAFADLHLPHPDELKALADMKGRGLFATVEWPALCQLLTAKSK